MLPQPADVRLLPRTALISAAIVAAVVLFDFVINVVITHAIENYTPWSTLAIVMIVCPPCVFVLQTQIERARDAQGLLASEQAARAAAEAINVARSRFLANTSHELRTPLNAVIGYAELLLENAEDEGRIKDAADLERIVASGQRLLRLVNDLLDLAKLEAARIEITPAPFNVATMLQEAIDIAAPTAARNRNRIKLTVAGPMPTASTDSFRLSQCVLNLLSNAAKFTSDGEIGVRAICEQSGGRDWLQIEVKDTGKGIAPEDQPLLFEPFMQARAESERPHEGTGLGLVITRRLARLMGGDVECVSEPRKGSLFTIRVPMHFIRADAAVETANALRASA